MKTESRINKNKGMPTQTPTVARRYYPTLSSVVSIDDLPDILGFIKDGVGSLLVGFRGTFSNFLLEDLELITSFIHTKKYLCH